MTVFNLVKVKRISIRHDLPNFFVNKGDNLSRDIFSAMEPSRNRTEFLIKTFKHGNALDTDCKLYYYYQAVTTTCKFGEMLQITYQITKQCCP